LDRLFSDQLGIEKLKNGIIKCFNNNFKLLFFLF
jgi:hypothetical protein